MKARFASLALLPLALWSAACASTGSSQLPASAQSTRTVITDANGLPEGLTSAAPVASRARSGFAVDSTLHLLEMAYTQAHVPVTLVDPEGRRLGNPRLELRGRLNGEALSRLVGCGQSLTTTHADRDQVTFSIVSSVHPVAGGSEVETLLTASAQDRSSGTVGEMINCTTTGVLESRIHQAAFGTP
jgi:hypothetical protein